MVQSTETRHLRSDARANHRRLLDTAARLFAERGADVPYEDIADAAGVGRATLYRHFPTREDLLAAILESMLDELQARADELPLGPERLLRIFDACVRLQEHQLPIIELAARGTTDARRRHIRRRFESIFGASLSDAAAAGLVRPDLTIGDIRVVLLMLSSLSRETIAPADRRRAAELARKMLA